MDGNRRWAKQQGLFAVQGHVEGAKRAREIVKYCISLGIPHITLWSLSTENWKKRNEEELTKIFQLVEEIPNHFQMLKDLNADLTFLGDIDGLPEKTRNAIHAMEKDFAIPGATFHVHLAINYGGREELAHAYTELLAQGKTTVTEEDITEALYTRGIPDVELILRTGGHKRLSGFMPWQAIYSEFYFTETFWPGLQDEEIHTALEFFNEEERNFGK